MRPIFFLLSLLIFATAATAAPVGLWHDLAEGARARLVAADGPQGGQALVGLEIDMPPGTKTYWRVPGETGIPALFDFSASDGVAEAAVRWPFPEIDRQQGFLDYVYHGPTLIPIDVEVTGAGAVLRAAVTLGICSDFCLPVRVQFELPLDSAAPDATIGARLEAAMARVPRLWDSEPPPLSVVIAGLDGSLHIENPAPSIDRVRFIAEIENGRLLFETPRENGPNRWTLAPLGAVDPAALVGKSVQLTFMAGLVPYSISRVIGPSQL